MTTSELKISAVRYLRSSLDIVLPEPYDPTPIRVTPVPDDIVLEEYIQQEDIQTNLEAHDQLREVSPEIIRRLDQAIALILNHAQNEPRRTDTGL